MPREDDRLIGAPALCEMLSCSRDQIDAMLRQRILPPPIRLSRNPRAPRKWWRSEVWRALEAQRKGY